MDGTLLLTEEGVEEAYAKKATESDSHYRVAIKLTPEAGNQLYNATEKIVKSKIASARLAIMFDNEVLMAPKVYSEMSQDIAISGGFTEEEAEELANAIRPGGQPPKESNSSDTELIKSLQELVDSYESIYQRVQTLNEAGVAGAAEFGKAKYQLLMAHANLETIKGNLAEAFQHDKEAVDAAESVVEAQETRYKSGQVTLEPVLTAKAELAKARIVLNAAREALEEQNR